eukprot:m51a1_g798 hypothetical protein (159) ;mRNA; f:649286-649762
MNISMAPLRCLVCGEETLDMATHESSSTRHQWALKTQHEVEELVLSELASVSAEDSQSLTTDESEDVDDARESELREKAEEIGLLQARVAELGQLHKKMSQAIAEADDRIKEAETELCETEEREASITRQMAASQAASRALELRLAELLKSTGPTEVY